MNKIVIFIMSMFLLFQSVPAIASNWKDFGTDVKGNHWYIDTDTITHEGKRTKFWSKRYVGIPNNYERENNIFYTKVYYVVNCSTRKSAVLKYTAYNFYEEPIISVIPNWGSDYIVPESIMDYLSHQTCPAGTF